MQVNEVPEPWASAMLEKDFTHGKRPSIRALSRAAGIGSAETVRQMIYGTRVPDPETVDRVASALGRNPVEVSRWVNQERTTRRPYVVPPEVALLTEDEQDAVSGLILAIARGRRGQAAVDSRKLRAVVDGHVDMSQSPTEGLGAKAARRRRKGASAGEPEQIS